MHNRCSDVYFITQNHGTYYTFDAHRCINTAAHIVFCIQVWAFDTQENTWHPITTLPDEKEGKYK